jgi:acyl-CoA oxidase
MPGVKTGDLGPKLGYHGKDNGWATFDNVRIPRNQLLQKFISIDRDGTFSVEGDLREMYGVMMLLRTNILYKTKYFIGRALTIGLRYSVVRRQFKNISGQKLETQLIDYQT